MKDNDNVLIRNKKNYNNIYKTSFGENENSKLFYYDEKNNICFSFTPKAGCTVTFSQFLDIVGLLEDALNYKPFVHKYRCEVLRKKIKVLDYNILVERKTVFLKFIVNPYSRVISIYKHNMISKDLNLTFREYLNILINKKDMLSHSDKRHCVLQYIEGEERIITKYIKLDKNESFNTIINGKPYTINPNNYSTGIHHSKRTDSTIMCGDIPRDKIEDCLPKSYKYFYDDDIKKMVEKLYKKDIEKYGYTFEEL
jgi:hypothetical protein